MRCMREFEKRRNFHSTTTEDGAEKALNWEALSQKLSEAERISVETQIQMLKTGPGENERRQTSLNGVKVVQIRDHAASNFRYPKVVLYDPANEKFMLFQREHSLAVKECVEFVELLIKLFLQYQKYAKEFRTGMEAFKRVSVWDAYLENRKLPIEELKP